MGFGAAQGGGGAVAVGAITGLGTGVATALAVNVGSAGAPVVLGGALGTPSSGVLTNATGLPSTGLAGWEAVSGGKWTPFSATELLTIAAAAETDTTLTLTPGDFILGVECRVTVAIPTAATFGIGVAGALTRFGAAVAVAANTTCVIPGAAFSPMILAAGNVAIRVTPNLTPADNTGRLRITVFGFRPTAATS